MKLAPENIPQEMKAEPRWVLWRYERRDGSPKPTKEILVVRLESRMAVMRSKSRPLSSAIPIRPGTGAGVASCSSHLTIVAP